MKTLLSLLTLSVVMFAAETPKPTEAPKSTVIKLTSDEELTLRRLQTPAMAYGQQFEKVRDTLEKQVEAVKEYQDAKAAFEKSNADLQSAVNLLLKSHSCEDCKIIVNTTGAMELQKSEAPKQQAKK